MWSAIEEICTTRFGIKRTAASLRAKWGTLQRDVYACLSCRSRVDHDKGTGNWSAERRLSLTHAYYTARKGANERNGKDHTSNRPFKYVEAAEFLSKCLKLMDGESPSTIVKEDRTVKFNDERGGNEVNVSDGEITQQNDTRVNRESRERTEDDVIDVD